MSLPAMRAIRQRFPKSSINILAKPAVAELYTGESCADEIILYDSKSHSGMARKLRTRRFDCAVLLPNSFSSAWVVWLAGIPNRIGYRRDGRGWLLTKAVDPPVRGEIPGHQRYYYLELLRRAGVMDALPEVPAISLEAGSKASPQRRIGVSPGAAYGTAKRWLPERFAEAAGRLAQARNASIALFGAKAERALCEQVAQMLGGHEVVNYAGETTLAQFIELASSCEVFLTNDSGAMHIASALGIPTIAIFGATDEIATGPTGEKSRVVRQPVECSPCLLRECPIDHRCMSRVSASRVVEEALQLLID